MIVAVATAGTPVRLRVMPLGELLDETFKLYRRHFTVIAGVALVIVLPNLILSLISGSYRANPFTFLQNVLQNVNNPDELARIQSRQSQYTSSPLYLLSFPIAALLIPFSVGGRDPGGLCRHRRDRHRDHPGRDLGPDPLVGRDTGALR